MKVKTKTHIAVARPAIRTIAIAQLPVIQYAKRHSTNYTSNQNACQQIINDETDDIFKKN